MVNKILKGTMFLYAIPLIIACNSKKDEAAAPVIDKEQIKKEIQAKETEYASTYNAGELKNIGYYADEATTFYQNRTPLVGKAAILDYLKIGLDDNTNKIIFKTNEVFPSNDGMQVVEIGSFTLVDSANNTINSGNYMSLFIKKDGKYYCVRDMSTSDIPLE